MKDVLRFNMIIGHRPAVASEFHDLQSSACRVCCCPRLHFTAYKDFSNWMRSSNLPSPPKASISTSSLALSGALSLREPYWNSLTTTALRPAIPLNLLHAHSLCASNRWIFQASSRLFDWKCLSSCTCAFGAMFGRAVIPPADPDKRPCSKISDFPPNTAKSEEGIVEVIRWSFPIFAHVSFTPTMLGCCANERIMAESKSIPAVMRGKLYNITGIGDTSATLLKSG